MSAHNAQAYDHQAASANRSVEDKLTLIAKSFVELAKVVGKLEKDIADIRRRGQSVSRA